MSEKQWRWSKGIEEGNAPRRKRVANKGARVEINLIVGDFFMAPIFDGQNYQGTVAFEVCRVLTTTHEGRHLVVEVRGGSSAKLVKRVDTLLGCLLYTSPSPRDRS